MRDRSCVTTPANTISRPAPIPFAKPSSTSRSGDGGIKARLNPGGRLIINTVSFPDPKKAALDGIEASVLSAFPEEIVYASPPETDDPEELVNVLIVAGENLHADPHVDPNPIHSAHLAKLLALARPGTRTATPCTDDRSNLDYAQASMRIHWREAIWETQSSNLLSD